MSGFGTRKKSYKLSQDIVNSLSFFNLFFFGCGPLYDATMKLNIVAFAALSLLLNLTFAFLFIKKIVLTKYFVKMIFNKFHISVLMIPRTITTVTVTRSEQLLFNRNNSRKLLIISWVCPRGFQPCKITIKSNHN